MNESKPGQVSVAMAVFNGAPYLAEQLKSIARQESLPQELVVCDDSSCDESATILADFAASAPFPVRIIRNPVNTGVVSTFERATRETRGDIVIWADQDDVWYANRVSTLREVFTGCPDVCISLSNATLINDSGDAIEGTLWDAISFGAREQAEASAGRTFYVALKKNVFTGAAMAFRRTLLQVADPFPRVDGSVWLHDRWLGFLGTCLGRVVVSASPTLSYRCHPAQSVGANRRTFADRVRGSYTRKQLVLRDDVLGFREALLRLERHSEVPQWMLYEIGAKLHHLAVRNLIPATAAGRVLPIARELVTGRYGRFSGGWMSAFRDLTYTSRGSGKLPRTNEH
jgi:glycosyltransferase involved in cell wall biosynthesis